MSGAPFAFLTLVDLQRSFWKSRQGIGTDGPTQNSVEDSFCQYVIASGEPFIAGDVRADPPLSVARGLERHDHVEQIAPGDTLLLYTDGLVETRGDAIDTGLDRLVRVLDSLAGDGLDAMSNALLAGMVGVAPADDVALIAVRFHPEDRPRPAEAGPATD